MSQKKVLVLGASGMLGAMVTEVLAREPLFQVTATVRSAEERARIQSAVPNVKCTVFDVEGTTSIDSFLASIEAPDAIVNAIGIIKPYIRDDNPAEILRACAVNALFPHRLAEAAGACGSRVLQIATDCVYSGATGMYAEGDKHDAIDVYGKTKSLGEAFHASTQILRCSIIGPEVKGFVSLLEWFRKNPKGATLQGFTNHQWNGVTTLHFAKLCAGVIRSDLKLPRLQHVIPSGLLSKYEMLRAFAEACDRSDLQINPTEAKVKIDRTLSTSDQSTNQALWRAAGYTAAPPTVPQMIAELGTYRSKLFPLQPQERV